MDFDAAATGKAERQAALIEALTATPTEAEPDPREQLERAVAELDRVLALVDQLEPAAPDFLAAVLADKAAKRQALASAVLGRNVQRTVATGSVSLDGGARKTPERPETHEQTLARVLRSGEANVGASL